MKAFLDRVGVKILLVMASAMTITSLVFLVIIVPRYHASLLEEREAGAVKLGSILQATLENAMLKRDIDGLRIVIDQIGRQKGVERVMILTPDGEVRFSSDAAMLGHQFDGKEGLCPGCGISGTGNAFGSYFFSNEKSQSTLRAVNAVANQEQCSRCHAPVTEHPVNGFLAIDYSASELEGEARRSAMLLAGAGFISLLAALAATWVAIQRFVLQPVKSLASASMALAGGDLSARTGFTAAPGASDEISILRGNFDRMAGQLEETISKLRDGKAFQQALIDSIPDGIRVINEEFSVIAANKEYCRQVGLTHEEVLSAPCYSSSHNRHERCMPTMVVCPHVTLNAPDAPQDFVKCSHLHSNHQLDRIFPVEVIAARLDTGEDGEKRSYIVESVRDLSRQIVVSQEQRLAEIGQLATGVAHEIRNPLASVSLGLRAISRSLPEGVQSDEIREYMHAVNTNIDECIGVTDRLLHLSRLPTEKGQLLTIQSIVGDTASLLRYEAEARRVETILNIPDHLRIVACDGSMRMVVFNLIQNAYHAMPSGGKLTITAREKHDGHIEISFTDTGTGIAPENLEKIFHPFWSWRADDSRGSGLGLPISRATVERWFGTISASSKPGKGATFVLDFPPADEVIERI